jgi:hypothetical protein
MMTKLMITVLTGLFVMSLGSVSLAGMLDKLTGKADEATQEASETVESTKAEAGEAIEAQDASTKESGSMMDEAKETVKETVDETIDGIGK